MHIDIPENRVKPVKKMNDKSNYFKNTCLDQVSIDLNQCYR